MLKNDIKGWLQSQGRTKAWVSKETKIPYGTIHLLVERNDLSTTPLGTLQSIADCMGLSVTDLYDRCSEVD